MCWCHILWDSDSSTSSEDFSRAAAIIDTICERLLCRAELILDLAGAAPPESHLHPAARPPHLLRLIEMPDNLRALHAQRVETV